MRVSALKKQTISPSQYLLAPLSDEEQLEAAFAICRQAFKKSKFSQRDVDLATEKIRRKLFVRKHSKRRH